jgi:hypothetical protein
MLARGHCIVGVAGGPIRDERAGHQGVNETTYRGRKGRRQKGYAQTPKRRRRRLLYLLQNAFAAAAQT